jgi:hypothetical protein
MKARTFRIGPVLCLEKPAIQAWIVTRETFLRIASNEAEAERYAHQMATDHGAPLDSSPRVDL